MEHNVEREHLIAELERQRAACKAAESMIQDARRRMVGPRAQMVAGYQTLRECRARIRQIRRELQALGK